MQRRNNPAASMFGILGAEIYFPSTYVRQDDFEVYNKVSKGKYTIGLGQEKMAFVGDREDINSVCLTVLVSLLEKYNVSPKRIGRVEVGTETLLDKSKSVKTYLMSVFAQYGNHDIEGIATTNACYGGTAALFNSLAWLQSPEWDGRLAIVIMGDLAVYAEGNARPTGGAGAVALLLGPGAPLVVEPIRNSFMNHAYDFYKPDPLSEYPTVDGALSIESYMGALDNCYLGLRNKLRERRNFEFNSDTVEYFIFHQPFGKQVQKSWSRLILNEILLNPGNYGELGAEAVKLKNPFANKEFYKKLEKFSNAKFVQKVVPGMYTSKNIGNSYTASLYAGLVSLICDPNGLLKKDTRIALFSYGSGLASSMFTVSVQGDLSEMIQKIDLHRRLDARICQSPEEYSRRMANRQDRYHGNNFITTDSLEELAPGTFYLDRIDERWRRFYSRLHPVETQNKELEVLSQHRLSANSAPIRPFTRTQPAIVENVETLAPIKGSAVPTKGNLWSGFHKKTLEERIYQLSKLYPKMDLNSFGNGGMDSNVADLMVENCIGMLSLPVGLAPNFKINGKDMTIPMAIEEPSVIAACSSAAKFIAQNSVGFETASSEPIMISQIQIVDVLDSAQVRSLLEGHKASVISCANQACPNMVKRGGGVIDMMVKDLGQDPADERKNILVLELLVNVCDSMGANILNTIAEQTGRYLEVLLDNKGRVALRILSNLCVYRRAKATFKMPVDKMSWKSVKGDEVAKRVLEAFNFAKLDPFRATTHNKGIMNGVDAAAIATGQDWRAVEAACHAFASLKGTYSPLTQYKVEKDPETGDSFFTGEIDLPLSLGVRGGVIQNNAVYRSALHLLGNPSSRELSEIISCVGLAQNFAAIRALAIEGIQKGHMKLHARNVAMTAGVPENLVGEVAHFMNQTGSISTSQAEAYMKAHGLYHQMRIRNDETEQMQAMSTFTFKMRLPKTDELLQINVTLDTQSSPIHLSFSSDSKYAPGSIEDKIKLALFGDKDFEWMSSFLGFVTSFSVYKSKNPRDVRLKESRLSVIAIMMNLLTKNLIDLNPANLDLALDMIVQQKDSRIDEIERIISKESELDLKYGMLLLLELYRIMNFSLAKGVTPLLRKAIKDEFSAIVEAQRKSKFAWANRGTGQTSLKEFLRFRQKKYSVTLIQLINCMEHNDSEISGELIEKTKNLGNVTELYATMVRDLRKTEMTSDESSYAFLNFLNGTMDKYQNADVKIAYATEMMNIIEPILNSWKREKQEELLGFFDFAKRQLDGHYKFNLGDLMVSKAKL
eukprot:CAMPEP_0115046288 /NCGR_PEP_ID=MMETSP0216-20121206/48662_1 /TAXON_ID=223996 /ORGANISM="Protocruzia adherens, Strain Boccale" /LENGTH=1286 /DNA_ID=CAMNT_0002429345 /DNA_START=2875 /DNA_END=6735 /DNA_ORIENTATION=+